MRLSNSDLELLYQRPRTNLNLFIFQPRAVMKARINNASIAKGARTIAFNSITLGSYLDVAEGMTLLVGKSAGAEDVGRIRIRSCAVNQMVVSENSNIKWENGLYLTVLRYWEVWPVYPRIIQNPSNLTDVIFYKDYDIPHTNQNNTLGTFINAGTHQGVLIENGTGTVYYNAANSLNLVGSSVTWAWSFEGGSPSGSSSITPGNVYYTTPGDYVTKIIATAGNGAIDTTYRYVSVKNKIGEGSITPIVRWKMNNLQGSRSEGGYTAEFEVHDQIDVQEGSVVVLASDDWYGNTHRTLGGNVPNSEKIFFSGYIERGSIQYSYDRSHFTFTAASITAIMKKATGFSVSVGSSPSATKWFQLLGMNIKRAIYHYLRWHSTVLNVADFEFVGQDENIQYFDADRGSLFDSIDNLLRGTLVGSLCADRQGKLWAEVDPKAYPNPTGTFSPVMDITRRSWMGEPNIVERLYDENSYTEMGGIAYSGPNTGTFTPLLADAPGGVPAFMGTVDITSGLALRGQIQLNQLVGHIHANKNQPYPQVSIESAINARNLDIAPQEVVSIHIAPEDTVRNIQINGIFIPSSFNWKYDPKNEISLPSIELMQLVNGNPGDTINIPLTPDDPIDGFEYPNYTFPPFPLDLPDLAIYDPTTIDNVIMAIKNKGLFYTTDFTSVFPTWYEMNLGLPNVANTVNFEVGAMGKVFYQYGNDSIWFAQYPGAVWGKIFDTTMIGNPESFPFPGGQAVSAFGIDRSVDDSLVIIGSLVVTIGGTCLTYAWKGDSNGVTLASTVKLLLVGSPSQISEQSGAAHAGFLTKSADGWLFTFYATSFYGSSVQLNSTASTASNLQLGQSGNTVIHTKSKNSPSTAVNLYHPYITNNNGSTWNAISGSPVRYGQADPNEFQSIITNSDGSQIVVGTNVNSGNGLVYSDNSGATWSTGTFATGTFAVTSVWHLDESAYIIGGYDPDVDGSSQILAIYDLINVSGTFAIDKTGNLSSLITGTFYPTSIRHYTTNE